MSAHIGVPSIYQNTVFSETIGPIELKFHTKTSYNKLAKIYANCFGRMTQMADMPIYVQNPIKIFSRTRRLLPWDLVCNIWDVEPIKFVQMMILG